MPGYKRHIERIIADGWFDRFPAAFRFASLPLQREFERLLKRGESFSEFKPQAELRLSGKADLLAYLYLHVAQFVRPGGRVGIITSNAWLDVDYGVELQRFLLDNFKVIALLESRCEPWFTEADVNTVVTVLERCAEPSERAANLVKFVKVKQRLSDLVTRDSGTASAARWKQIDAHVSRIQRACWKDRNTRPFGVKTEEDDSFRIRICRQDELSAELKRKQRTTKWGVFLRAPEIYFDLPRLSSIPFIPLGEIASVVNGFVTRINEFFYLTDERIGEFGIEEEFIKPVLRSPREFRSLCISPDELKSRVFICPLSKEELRSRKKHGGLRYIEWGEAQRTVDGVPWPDGPSVRSRRPGWWSLGLVEPAQLFWAEHLGESLAHRFSDHAIYADHNLHLVRLKDNADLKLVAAFVNSSVGFLMQEVVARQSLGGGASKLIADDIECDVLLPMPSAVETSAARTVTDAFTALATRDVGSIFEEVKKSDRRALDCAVLEAIGLKPRLYEKRIHDALCALVGERIGLAQSRIRQRTTRSRSVKAERAAIETVLNSVFPDGPMPFPDHFYSATAIADEKITIELPANRLVFEDTPMFKGVHSVDGEFHRPVKTPAEGRFLIYAQRAGSKAAVLPRRPVEVSRTVANYEKYLREVRADLYTAYYRQTLDAKAAERLTQAAFDRFRLPTPESIG